MKEIGGYFGLDYFISKPYYTNMIELNTGRNALLYLIQAKNIARLYIPHYLCNSISDVLKKDKVKYEFYNIDDEFNIIFKKILEPNSYIFLINYFGQIRNEIIKKLSEDYKRIIVDNTQAFFQEPVHGVDTIYSCRKYFGLPDGAYLYTDSELKRELEPDVSRERMAHILGRFEGKASEYYTYFKEKEETLSDLPIRKMSKLTRNILGAIDYEQVKESRNRNFSFLHNKLADTNILCIKTPKGPFAYPYYLKNGIAIRKELVDKKIYIPILWPNVLKESEENSIEYDFAANILPLPCDQRYGAEDMERIYKSLATYIS